MVRAGREALPRHGMDFLRGRRGRQASARRRDPQRDQRRHDRRPALSGREPGDHGARRPRRHDPAALAATRIRVRRDRQRLRGDAPLRAHVRQVRRRLAEDQPVGRVDHRHAGRDVAVHRRRGRDLRAGGQGLGPARVGACAFVLVDQAMREAGHRGDLSRELHRHRGARHARGAQERALHRARPRVARSTPAITRASGASRPRWHAAWVTTASSRRRSSR